MTFIISWMPRMGVLGWHLRADALQTSRPFVFDMTCQTSTFRSLRKRMYNEIAAWTPSCP